MSDPSDQGSFRQKVAGIADPIALLEGVLANSPVPYMVLTAEGHPLLTNPAFRQMFGREPPPDYNVHLDELLDRQPELRAAVIRAFAGETVETPVFWYDPNTLEHVDVDDARKVAIACTLFPLHGPDGRLSHVAIAYRDKTSELSAQRVFDQALAASEERLRHTLDAARVGTWEWNIPENKVQWSENIERIFAMTPGSFDGTYEGWLALLHPDDVDAANQRVRRALEGHGPYEAELRFVRADGSIGWHSTRGYVVPGPDGKPRLLRGIVLDVTSEVQARQHTERLAEALRNSESRYRAFVGQSTEGIWRFELEVPLSIDTPADQQVEFFYQHAVLAECNDATARMYGFERADALIGTRLPEFMVREDPRNAAYLRAFVDSNYRLENAESHEVDRHGQRRVFHNSLVGVVEDGKLLRAWGTQRDVTAQVDAHERAVAANRTKDEFLAMLGHELRNPLSPIQTAVELMRLRGPEHFTKEREIIERQVNHVVRMVDDLLDVSRMTRGKVSLQKRPLELTQVVAAALELASPLLEQSGHHLTVDLQPELTVEGDFTRLVQVFTNLLSNAAKYTPHGGRIKVIGDRMGDRVRVRVQDTGIGMRAEMLPQVFELFVQEQQGLDRSQGGLGLGLAIARSLVTAHGGTIEAHSEGPGRGSEFVVFLPRAEATPATVGAPLEPPAAALLDGRRVLVVDDNEDAAAVIAETLTDLGHTVKVAHHGPGALELLLSFTPEIAFLDIGLPVMDGYELARRIRKQPELASITLVAVTGYGRAEDRQTALNAGFSGHLVKPVRLAELQRMVRGLDPA